MVVNKEKAAIGVFVTLQPSTEPMRKEAIQEGLYKPEHLGEYERIQIITVDDIFIGKIIQYPRFADVTFKPAKPKYKDIAEQGELILSEELYLDPRPKKNEKPR